MISGKNITQWKYQFRYDFFVSFRAIHRSGEIFIMTVHVPNSDVCSNPSSLDSQLSFSQLLFHLLSNKPLFSDSQTIAINATRS